jgi:hypothetical protein
MGPRCCSSTTTKPFLRLLLLLLLLLLSKAAASSKEAASSTSSTVKWACSKGVPQPDTGCTASKYAEEPAASAGACCALCSRDKDQCQAWTFHPQNASGGSCYLSDTPHCRSVDGAVGGCDPSNVLCHKGPGPDPHACQPVIRPPAPVPAPLPHGVRKPPHLVSILVCRGTGTPPTPPPLVIIAQVHDFQPYQLPGT